MLEDCTMEKKSSGRTSQPPIKGNGTESKKIPDSVGSKIFPRTSRRREPVNFQGPKYEANRKPIHQKRKSNDKRPRPRGQYYSSGKEDTKVAEDEHVEHGSVIAQGSKKQNLNHLLNFHYAPRDGINTSLRHWRDNSGGWGRSYVFKSHKHKYNKEQFLQANCQFVVKSDGDYSSYMVNPDVLVDWEFIEQIRLRCSEILSCPICLYPPVAAKITRCGHVFCWPCILHYLSLSDKSWRKCPICYESVNKQDLKSVVAIPHNSFSVGEEITLRLMKRKRGSLIAVPVDQSEIYSTENLLFVSETEVDTKYSKLLLASSLEVSSIINREKIELELQLSDEQDCPEICFIEQALELLKERAACNQGGLMIQSHACSTQEKSNCDAEMFHLCDVLEDQDDDQDDDDDDDDDGDDDDAYAEAATDVKNAATIPEIKDAVYSDLDLNETNQNTIEKCNNLDVVNRLRYESVSSEGLGSEEGTVPAEEIDIPNSDKVACSSSAPKDFYFYQVTDGQHIYLHAVNVRMLEHYYGCLKNCPLTLTGRIMEKESLSMTEELRQRIRCLQHLPITCQFEVAEIQLKSPIVNRETIELFQDQLETRRRRRARRARDERRREMRINEEENRRWGKCSSPNISIGSHHQFPSCGFEEENAGSTLTSSSLTTSPIHTSEAFSNLSSTLENVYLDDKHLQDYSVSPGPENLSPPGPSFAQMLRDGKSKPLFSWAHGSVEKQKEHSSFERNMYASYGSDSDPESKGYVPAKQNFGDAIAEAMERAAAAAALSKDDMQDVSGSSGKKKKKQKQKQKLLFATGMACISK